MLGMDLFVGGSRRLRFGAVVGLASAAALLMSLLFAGTAAAAHVDCGDEITTNTTLDSDVGPCTGHGLVVTADNVTLDLGGHTISGAKMEAEQAGVLLDGVSGVTVRNGTVTGFDAGVSIEEGSGNTVTGLTVTNNVNDMIEAIDPRSIEINRETGPTPEQRQQMRRVTCDYGDGITTLASSDNVITGNRVIGNGPYSGISLVDDSNGNTVSGNEVRENDLLNTGVVDAEGDPVFVLDGRHVPAGTEGATQPTSMCGATEIGTPGMGRGREVQSIGIRVEGPGADNNLVDRNVVTKSGLAGISFHSYVANPAGPNVPEGSPSSNNVVSQNSVSLTGADTHESDEFADGIASLSSGPIGRVTLPSDTNTIVRNRSFDNFRHGISLGRLTFDNTIDKNVANDNAGSGVWVADGAHDNLLKRNHGKGNGEFDGADMNEDCDDNRWLSNNFRTFNQPCVVPGRSGSAPGRSGQAGGSDNANRAGIDHPRR